jgi:hypothetical protein
LAGIAAGWLVVAPGAPRSGPARRYGVVALQTLAFGTVATLPDLDLLIGLHSGPTHGLGSALIVGIAVLAFGLTPAGARALARLTGAGPPALLDPRAALRLGAGAALAYATHPLLDWMGNDTTPPIGIMVLWPFDSGYYQSDLHVFMAISRRPWLPGFWAHNLTAVVREVLILAPVVAAVWLARRPRVSEV